MTVALKHSDPITVDVALGDRAYDIIIGRDVLKTLGARVAALRPGAILVNTARGALVQEDALLDALRRGHLAHAALDVFDQEPLPPGHPLTLLDNVTLSAHSAFRTPEANEALIRRALDIACNLPPPQVAQP